MKVLESDVSKAAQSYERFHNFVTAAERWQKAQKFENAVGAWLRAKHQCHCNPPPK